MQNQNASQANDFQAQSCSSSAACASPQEHHAGQWLKVGIAAVFAGQGMMFSLALSMTPPPFASVAYQFLHIGLILSALLVCFLLGGPLLRALIEMVQQRTLSIAALFFLSLCGAFAGSLVSTFTGRGGVYYEVVAIVLGIYTFGRLLGDRSQSKLHLASQHLSQQYSQAALLDEGGSVTVCPVESVRVGDRVEVAIEAPFTLDGFIVSGLGYVQETALTGEPLPAVRRAGDFVQAGTWSVDARFVVEVTAAAGERVLDEILETVQSVDGQPSVMQLQAHRLVRYFVPVVMTVSALTGLYWWFFATWIDGFLNSMAVLLVACPCALGLATPAAIWQGLYALAQRGLVSRDGQLIDVLANTQHIFFDKTGTLSDSNLRVVEELYADPLPFAKEKLLAAACAIESKTAHPVAQSIRMHFFRQAADSVQVNSWRLVSGQGIVASLSLESADFEMQIGEASLCQNAFLQELAAMDAQVLTVQGKRIYGYVNGVPCAVWVLQESPRPGLHQLGKQLLQLGLKGTVLTGDPQPQLYLPSELDLHSKLSAAEKVCFIERSKSKKELPVFVGDGINDASAMKLASAAIAMQCGTEFAQSAANAQLAGDRLHLLPQFVKLARRVQRRIQSNLLYAFTYNLLGMGLAAAGWLHPIFAALIMLLSSLFVTSRAVASYD
jgi:heavy metal translocating P-type ATPase